MKLLTYLPRWKKKKMPLRIIINPHGSSMGACGTPVKDTSFNLCWQALIDHLMSNLIHWSCSNFLQHRLQTLVIGLSAAAEAIFVTGRQMHRVICEITIKVWGQYIEEERGCLGKIIWTETTFTDEFTNTTPKGLKTKKIKQTEKKPLNEQFQTFDYCH